MVGRLFTGRLSAIADQSAGYTTLIGFAVSGGHVIGAANGDSALWLAGADGHILDLTARQAKNPPIGSGGAAPTPFAAKMPASWIVLAMSDGVWIGSDASASLNAEVRVGGKRYWMHFWPRRGSPGAADSETTSPRLCWKSRDDRSRSEPAQARALTVAGVVNPEIPGSPLPWPGPRCS
jgi:hypothetical protein